MSRLHQANAYIRHWLLAVGKHSLHEPFIFELFDKVIAGPEMDDEFSAIEDIRKSYFCYNEKINLSTLGAPSLQGKRSLHQIARFGGTPSHYAQILYRLLNFSESMKVIELGTSLGLTSLYLAWDDNVSLKTLEGDPVLIQESSALFERMKKTNIEIIQGNIDHTLKEACNKLGSVDMAYFDANHSYEPTLRYFNQIFPFLHERSILVLDDIHWSREMSRAWEDLRADSRVTLSVDLFQMGLIFFRPFRQKYHYRLRRSD